MATQTSHLTSTDQKATYRRLLFADLEVALTETGFI
jgi:hypothetical protein